MFEASRLLRPLLFLRIKTFGLSMYIWVWPLCWFVALCLFLALFFQGEIWHISTRLVEESSSFLVMLPGFFIIALCALAALNLPILDMPFMGKGAILKRREGETRTREISRRRFLSLLFGYLAFLSLCLSLANMIFLTMVIPEPGITIGRLVFACLYGFFFLQLVSLTMLALFYLCDRLYWREESLFEE